MPGAKCRNSIVVGRVGEDKDRVSAGRQTNAVTNDADIKALDNRREGPETTRDVWIGRSRLHDYEAAFHGRISLMIKRVRSYGRATRARTETLGVVIVL